uniref:Uncharacterized protein n=1 Tax=Timema bartmani TaxID=61472 RepID=A0A7R9F322_9NEOP|nr:unnamed protein product [Timema bartmani]
MTSGHDNRTRDLWESNIPPPVPPSTDLASKRPPTYSPRLSGGGTANFGNYRSKHIRCWRNQVLIAIFSCAIDLPQMSTRHSGSSWTQTSKKQTLNITGVSLRYFFQLESFNTGLPSMEVPSLLSFIKAMVVCPRSQLDVGLPLFTKTTSRDTVHTSTLTGGSEIPTTTRSSLLRDSRLIPRGHRSGYIPVLHPAIVVMRINWRSINPPSMKVELIYTTNEPLLRHSSLLDECRECSPRLAWTSFERDDQCLLATEVSHESVHCSSGQPAIIRPSKKSFAALQRAAAPRLIIVGLMRYSHSRLDYRVYNATMEGPPYPSQLNLPLPKSFRSPRLLVTSVDSGLCSRHWPWWSINRPPDRPRRLRRSDYLTRFAPAGRRTGSYKQHQLESDVERVQQIIQRALQDAEWVVKKYKIKTSKSKV